jgi:carbonic anhydrase/acetyltransferase-like protein (isoleucine patch superfamily)
VQRIHESVWIAPGAQLYGRIEIGEGSSVWPYCVIRSECREVRVGRATNLQDFVMIHVGYEEPTIVGDFCSVAHHATIHGATIEDDCLIGIQAVVMNGARIGRGSIVAPGAIVTEGSVIPPHSIVAGVPARVVRSRDASAENRLNALHYQRNAQAYRRGDHRAWEGADYERWLEEARRRA